MGGMSDEPKRRSGRASIESSFSASDPSFAKSTETAPFSLDVIWLGSRVIRARGWGSEAAALTAEAEAFFFDFFLAIGAGEDNGFDAKIVLEIKGGR